MESKIFNVLIVVIRFMCQVMFTLLSVRIVAKWLILDKYSYYGR